MFITKEFLEAGFVTPVNLDKVESGRWKTWSGVIPQLSSNFLVNQTYSPFLT